MGRINLRPNSTQAPLEIDRETYDEMVKKNSGGWSQCADRTEWLAKLHYLRSGLELGKLDAARFEEREERLVEAWLINHCR